MATPKYRVSQDVFDAAVQENMDEFGMEKDEAIDDAIKTFTMQGADVSGLVVRPDSESSVEDPLILAINKLTNSIKSYRDTRNIHGAARDPSSVSCDKLGIPDESTALGVIVSDLQTLRQLLNHSGAQALLGSHEVFESIVNLLTYSDGSQDFLRALEPTLDVLCLLLEDDTVKLRFLKHSGPAGLMATIRSYQTTPSVIQQSSNVIVASSSRFEVTKEAFMDADAHLQLLDLARIHLRHAGAVQAAASALQTLATADDPRVIASKAFGNARSIAKAGAATMILEAFETHKENLCVVGTLCVALKAIAVNDEICTQIEEQGGLTLLLHFLQASISRQDPAMAQACMGLLGQLAGNDANKTQIVRGGGLDLIVSAVTTFLREAPVVQECLALIAIVCLRSPTNAAAAFAAGAVEVGREAMEEHEDVPTLLRQAARMIRNMAVRNPENRPLIVELGVVPLLRRAKAEYKECRDVAGDALRDLGFDDYND